MSKAAKRGKKKEASNPSVPLVNSASAEALLQNVPGASGAQSVASNVPPPSSALSQQKAKAKATPGPAKTPVKPAPKPASKSNPPANSNNLGPVESSTKKKPDPPAQKPPPAPPKPAKGAKNAAPKPTQPASGSSKSAITPAVSTPPPKKGKKSKANAPPQNLGATSSGPTASGSSTHVAAQLSAASPSLSATAPSFVPNASIGHPVQITTPNGHTLVFNGQAPPGPKAKIPGVGTSVQPPSLATRIETKAQKEDRLAKERKEQVARKAKEEKQRLEEERRLEEAERKEREEAERKAREKAEKAKVKAERKRKAGEAQRKAEEEEQRAWEEEEKAKDEERRAEARRLEAEREAQEKAEAKRERKRKNKEARRIAKEEQDARLKAEAAAKINEETEEQDTSPALASPKSTNNSLLSTVPDLPPSLPKPTPTSKSPECPPPNSSEHSTPGGSPLAVPMPAPAQALRVDDLKPAPDSKVVGKSSPEQRVNDAPSPSRFSRDFLSQSMNGHKDRPHSLAPIGSLGLEPRDQGASSTSVPHTGDWRSVRPTTMGDVFKELAPKSISTKPGGFSVGNSKTPWSRMSDSQSRPDAPTSTRGGAPSMALTGGRLPPMTNGGRPTGAPRALRPTEPVAPPKTSTRWLGASLRRVPGAIQDLLNKLTPDNFVSVSHRIVQLAGRSEHIKNGSLLMRIAKLVFNSARNDPMYGEMYARLCRKMIKSLSPDIRDDTVCDWDEQPVMGGMLFRKYLLHLCQEEFERGWNVKWAETSAVSKVKRQGLGLVRFMGELFKLKLLTERTMHECIKKLLSNNIKPKEEDIESLRELLTTAGRMLDNPKACNRMDIFFKRIDEIANKNDLGWRIRFMLQDVIELRARRWQARRTEGSTEEPPHETVQGNIVGLEDDSP